jgi:hypothetical protein
MAVVAEEARVVVGPAHVVAEEVQGIGHVLPIRNQRRHYVVHGKVGIGVHVLPDQGQIPSPVLTGVGEARVVHGVRRGYHEEVPHARRIIDEPVGRLGKEHPVVSASSGETVLVRGRRIHEAQDTVRGDLEDGHVGVVRGPVVDPDPIAAL